MLWPPTVLYITHFVFSPSEEAQLAVHSNTAKAKAVRFYNSCMDTRRIDALGAQPLKELINEVITVQVYESDP